MTKQPDWIEPMLAVLHKNGPFDHPEWIFEKKLDGIRCLAFCDAREIRLLSRNKKRMNDEYPEIVQNLKTLSDKEFIVDGEIVVDKGKIGSFEKLQRRSGNKDPSQDLMDQFPVSYYIFDLLFLDGEDLRKKPLVERKKRLKKLSFSKPILFTPHRNKEGKNFLKKVSRQKYEGAIAKKQNGAYLSKRTADWLKLKVQNRQEFVIGGFTDPKGKRKGFGALLVGYYSPKNFVYAGRVGTGFSDSLLEDLHKKLKKIEKRSCSFTHNPPKNNGSIHWVEPKYVAELKFTEWTPDSKLRHPAFLGLRDDKNPKDVVPEVSNRKKRRGKHE